MLNIRKARDRGHANHGWLDSHHTFSFANYSDPAHMGFGHLRVINEDRVAPGQGFGTHPHRDMEIISYVLDGALAHKDSMGNGSVMRPGDVQRMSAGTGVTHSEFNASTEEEVHFLQIWVLPDAPGHEPGYEQVHFPDEEKRGRLRLVASATGREGSISLNQDADLYAGLFDGSERAAFEIRPSREAWLQVARGEITVNGERLLAGDGVSSTEAGEWVLGDGKGAEILLFDMARRG
ncbi:MAG: pirin family protein [Xanthomonadales bacterium]|jgi:redox-sensitive bicupin YhaK (pirin superfamily)|nr:pirin family protein [Xanthomonadales bacterium]